MTAAAFELVQIEPPCSPVKALIAAVENVRAFRHEVHAAEDDVAALGLRRLVGKLEGVAAEIGEFDDFVALVVMAKDDDVIAEAGFCSGDALIERIVRHKKVGVEVAPYAGFDFRGPDGRRRVSADEGGVVRNGYQIAHRGYCSCSKADAQRSQALEA